MGERPAAQKACPAGNICLAQGLPAVASMDFTRKRTASCGSRNRRHLRPLDRGRAGTARASIRAKHAHVRAPRIGCTTAFDRGVGAARATSCQPRVNEQKEGHWANSL